MFKAILLRLGRLYNTCTLIDSKSPDFSSSSRHSMTPGWSHSATTGHFPKDQHFNIEQRRKVPPLSYIFSLSLLPPQIKEKNPQSKKICYQFQTGKKTLLFLQEEVINFVILDPCFMCNQFFLLTIQLMIHIFHTVLAHLIFSSRNLKDEKLMISTHFSFCCSPLPVKHYYIKQRCRCQYVVILNIKYVSCAS